MRSRRRASRVAAVLGLLVLGWSRQTFPAPPETAVVRLAPLLAPRSHWLMRGEQSPGVVLKQDHTSVVAVSAVANSRLSFSLGTLRGAPRHGQLELEIRADGARIATIRVPARRANAWRKYSFPLPMGVQAKLEFATRLVRDGGPRPRRSQPEPWIALGAPRIVAPVVVEARRVLVWISVDTLRADHLGAYGYRHPTSPNIDRFLRSAARFTDAFSASSWTLPSLSSQFTSRPPSLHGAVAGSRKRDPANATVFQALASHGFTVLGVTANSFVSPKFETASGFDALWDTDGDAGEVTRLALNALERWDGGHLALFVHYLDPHAYYEPPQPFKDLFQPAYQGPMTTRNFQAIRNLHPAGLRFLRGGYDGEIAFTDAKVGELLAGLDERGLLERAVVVFSADHGEEFQEHGGWGHGHTLYQEMLHVPLGVRVPGLPALTITAPVSTVDLAPTLLDALGVPPPASFLGRTLMPLLRRGVPPTQTLIAETERTLDGTRHLALRRGSLKYVRVLDARADDATLRESIYDLADDPGELRPLGASPERDALGREAEAYLARVRAEARASLPAELSAEERERLQALGYLQ